uniref:Serine-threonine/tyrosine-protein kinase catalytic domain-containing protein n=1 Tax=Kalanchoe fedtschenkoi TaxID=63787 RepID=A0A7N0TA65_KALFE
MAVFKVSLILQYNYSTVEKIAEHVELHPPPLVHGLETPGIHCMPSVCENVTVKFHTYFVSSWNLRIHQGVQDSLVWAAKPPPLPPEITLHVTNMILGEPFSSKLEVRRLDKSAYHIKSCHTPWFFTQADTDVQPYAFIIKSKGICHIDYSYQQGKAIDMTCILDKHFEDCYIIGMSSTVDMGQVPLCKHSHISWDAIEAKGLSWFEIPWGRFFEVIYLFWIFDWIIVEICRSESEWIVTHNWEEHLVVKYLCVEGQLEFKAMLFVLRRAPFDWFDTKKKPNDVKLYVRRVFNLYNCEQNKIDMVIRKNLVKECIALCQEIAENKEEYYKFNEALFENMNLDIYKNSQNKMKLAELLTYHFTKSGDEMSSLKDYVSRTKEGQNDIYNITGESKKVYENSLFIEKLRKKGCEVHFMVDAIVGYVIRLLKLATKDFCPDNLFEEGGFRSVFKGWVEQETLAASKLRTGGLVMAIQKLDNESCQGHREWLAEVNFWGQLHQLNLVKLLGCCLEIEQRLLVYEFMSRGSLESHLFMPRWCCYFSYIQIFGKIEISVFSSPRPPEFGLLLLNLEDKVLRRRMQC